MAVSPPDTAGALPVPASPELAARAEPPGAAEAPAWHALLEEAPPWMRAAAAALAGYTLFLLTPSGQRIAGTALDTVGSTTRLLVEGAAFFWAIRRVDLPPRLVLAFRISAWTSMATAATYVPTLVERLGFAPWISPTTDSALTLAGYIATVAALLVYPRTPAQAGEGASLAIDQVVSTGSLALLSWTLVTQVSTERAGPSDELFIRVFGLAQMAMIAGLNVLVVRGRPVPSRRAFWWFVAGQTLYVPVTLAVQFEEAGLLPAWPGNVVYFLGVLPTFVACLAVRRDPWRPASHGTGPAWLYDLNPVPLSMPLFLGAALLVALTIGPATPALPLAAALMVVSMLLAVRLLLSAHRSGVQARTEAEREQRRQGERLQAVGRLAGGIAHEFNNLMARVVGHTELGEAESGTDVGLRDHFVRARMAALRAAELTNQLLAFSGQQRSHRRLIDVEATVHERYLQFVGDLPSSIAPQLHRGRGPMAVVADDAQLADAVQALVDNAVEAMPHGGALTVHVSREHVASGTTLTPLSVPGGTYVIIAVGDTGVGMSPDAVATACDPFYSTKPAHLGAGMGLASVHGFIASHSGGLAIDSARGKGTTVRLYLPAV